MSTTSLIHDVRAYCQAAGVKPSTLGVKLFNNSRYFARLARRAEEDAEAERKIREFIAANPPPSAAPALPDAA